ncbi:23S rRNA pseudouridine(955/2504/2580) synthase RluC [Neptunomonas sp.]|uniref:23S rRNA pseudouridine(955/2504/2580) synthase RluC n=1 Tax=Neptunomonas sp. TaxID=1971898 RepID=UPI0025D61CCB|nr:23S rRNA pseudouridine(955/2504/2580) synthase RluC [Neptunomonas sp.]
MSDTNPSANISVRYIEVEEDQAGQRIDNFLRTALKGVPKSMIYRIIRKGEVRVNKKRIKPDGRIQGGDLVRIPPIRVSEPNDVPIVGKALLELLEASVLYESKALIVINKPSGLAVHGGSGINLGLIEAMRQLRPDEHFLELVHRLDRDTSGCIMIAKKRSMLRHLHEALRQNRVNKIYHALVVGKWESKNNSVDAPLRKNELQSGERIVKVQPDGKASLTRFKVLRRFAQTTLVEAKPVTGRTHQIRVHTQFAGHPIVGDEKYGVESINRDMKKQGVRRLFLHSAMLQVALPEGETLNVKAPLESALSSALERLAAQQDKAYQEES